MKKSDIDINKIIELLQEVPDDFYVTSIDLDKGYNVNVMIAEHDRSVERKQKSLEQLMQIIKALDFDDE